jgi:phosphatidylserine/phosphatidylglycerophosphate/cardiolipin synthase-like enzyme
MLPLATLTGLSVAVILVYPPTGALADAAAEAGPRGCVVSGDYETCLTDPEQVSNGHDTAIEDRLRQLTQSAGSGDVIRISEYTWTRPELARDLVAAKDRGVDVKVVLDGINKHDHNGGYTTLTDGGIPLTSCSHGSSCLGTHFSHNKLFLFDIGGVKQVAVTSTNLTTAQMALPNNMLKVSGDDKLYAFFLGYWNRLNAQSWTYDGDTWDDDDKVAAGSKSTYGYAYPRHSDNVLTVLNKVKECSGSHNRIMVAAALFTKPRVAIRDRLAALQDKLGCDVQVIVGDRDTESWVQAANSSGDLRNGKVSIFNSHNKLIMIDAKYGDEWQRAVWSGSHNLSGTSLRTNDETLAYVNDPRVEGRYAEYFDAMMARATGT